MRWPLMLRRTHDARMAYAVEIHHGIYATQRERYQKLVDAEYKRARDEGRAQVHRWAVDINFSIFHGFSPFEDTPRWKAYPALQQTESEFNPTHTQLEADKEH